MFLIDKILDKITDKILDNLVEKINDPDFQKDFLIPLTDSIMDRQILRFQNRLGGWNKTGSAERTGFDLDSILKKRKIGLADIAQIFLSFRNQPGSNQPGSDFPAIQDKTLGSMT